MATKRNFDEQRFDQDGELISTGSANAYVVRGARAVRNNFKGLRLKFKPNFTNTGATTLQYGDAPAASIVRGVASALLGNDIISGQYCEVIYDNTNGVWQLDGGQFVKITGDTITVPSGDVTALNLDESASSLDTQPAFRITLPTTGAQKGFQLTTPGAIAGWASFELNIGGTGKVGFAFGPGSAVRDTNIYRDSADTLKTDDSLIISGTLTAGIVPVFTNIPQNSKSAAYTTVLADAQKHILHPAADNNARTFTIDSNANVAYPIGTAISFVNEINTLTIAITSDTMKLAGSGATGSRTLAANGIATALKTGTTSWLISGTGLT